MDPLGLALENFDATGMARSRSLRRRRDRLLGRAAGRHADQRPGRPSRGAAAAPEQFVQTFTEGLLTYATGRKLEFYDMPTVRKIVRGAARSDYRFSTIVQAVVRSDQFRMRRVPAGPGG